MIEGTPNLLSTLALFLFVPVALVVMKRRPAAQATALLALGGVLFLPEVIGFKLPGLPEFQKPAISSLWIFVGAMLFHRQRFKSLRLARGSKVAITMLLAGAVLTVLSNTDDFAIGSKYFPGHRPYDAVHYLIYYGVEVVLPFVVGAAMFRTSDELAVLLKMTVGAAVVYSLFQLIELRLSPQLNSWVYGYHQHDFVQTIRDGGFRPMVFMSHGLAVSIFTTIGVFAAAGLHKARARVFRIKAAWLLGYLWLLLSFLKSVAAFLYSMLTVPLILFASPKNQIRIAAILASLIFVYPVARAVGLIPVQEIKAFVAEQYGGERARSVMTRFENEDELVTRASERLLFGWGSYCRGCIFDEWTGKEVSVRDGDWIIMLGDSGLVGFVGKFLLLVLPVFFVRRRFDHFGSKSHQQLLSTLSLIVAFSIADLIPNGNFNYLPMLYSGALYGSASGMLWQQAVRQPRQPEARAASVASGQT